MDGGASNARWGGRDNAQLEADRIDDFHAWLSGAATCWTSSFGLTQPLYERMGNAGKEATSPSSKSPLSDQAEIVQRSAVAALPTRAKESWIHLTTLPTERHGFGLPILDGSILDGY